ncbi:MAG: zf-HC2 domain-containing protein [Armatimonadota bacterium]|nr:zf-HC2 domain-containing protein [Armatimonadota bacterium]
MNCSFVSSRMSCYIDGELPGDEMLSLRRHVESCASCRKQFETEKRLKRVLGTLPEREASPDFEGRLMAAVRQAGAGQSESSASVWPSGRMALALAAAAVAIFCVFALKGNNQVVQPVGGNEIALDQDWNNARSVFPASNLPAGLEGP